MKRLLLNISTTGGVVLFTMGALRMLDAGNYLMAGMLLFFAFWLPANRE